MSAPLKSDAYLALHRFGLGPRPSSLATVEPDPRGALLTELDGKDIGRIPPAGDLRPSAEAFRVVFEANAARRARQVAEQRREKEAERKRAEGQTGTEMMGQPTPPVMPAKGEAMPNPARQIFLREIRARVDAALTAEIGFVERLVWFWSNHFCISADKITSMAGAYEREAIRPHVLGRFQDMLQAVAAHPAMLIYLDNVTSMGPNSVAGLNRTRGLNENFARELMELHTLGVRTGYSQDDVIHLANVLTGWTILPAGDNPDHGGEFIFNRRLHEPGPQTVLGKVYADGGVEQGRAVLHDLARHPATAQHIARKLARHFIADEPPPAMVDRLAKTFLESDGNLKTLAAALVQAPEAWSSPRSKLKRPGEWVISMVRATGAMAADPGRFAGGQATLGEPIWRPPSPKGFADDAASWLDGQGQRLDIANTFAQRIADRVDPRAVIEVGLGPLASADTRQAVARAESRQQALTLLFMSGEFQRR